MVKKKHPQDRRQRLERKKKEFSKVKEVHDPFLRHVRDVIRDQEAQDALQAVKSDHTGQSIEAAY